MDLPTAKPLKRLLNQHEEITHETLASVCTREGASIFSKVRLADILPIEGSGLSDADFEFALKSHLDFTVADKNLQPLFAVEYDGRTHQNEKQQQRDARKNRLCEQFGLPLLRINSKYLRKTYRGMDLLSWFVETWFAAQAFAEAQEHGYIPFDEPFMGSSFITIPGRKERHPLWLSVDSRIQIRRLSMTGKCSDPIPSHIVGADEEDNCHAIGWCRVTPDTVVWVKTAMRAQLFPVSTSEALSEIVIHDLYRKLVAVIEAQDRAVPLSQFKPVLAQFKTKYQLRQAGIYGRQSE
jgi:hypothetical protein